MDAQLKTVLFPVRFLATLAVLMLLTSDLCAQSGEVDKAVNDKRFTINVESMSPRRGGYRRLTTQYTFVVTPDTIVTELPYMGRAYQAPMGSDNTGVKFLSRDFTYETKPGKKGAWEITLKPKDTPNYPMIFITLQTTGAASIRMTPVDREFISYGGTLKK